MSGHELTPEQRTMVEVWERHMAAEFEAKSVEATMATMTSDPFVNHVPVMTGGVGYTEVRHFYGTYFIPGQPSDTEVVPRADSGTGPYRRRTDSQVYTHDRDVMDPPRRAAHGQASRSRRRRGRAV